jgi:hypothetical protein
MGLYATWSGPVAVWIHAVLRQPVRIRHWEAHHGNARGPVRKSEHRVRMRTVAGKPKRYARHPADAELASRHCLTIEFRALFAGRDPATSRSIICSHWPLGRSSRIADRHAPSCHSRESHKYCEAMPARHYAPCYSRFCCTPTPDQHSHSSVARGFC